MRTGALVAIALGLLGIGLLLGLIPGSIGPSSDSLSCGSPWVRDTAAIEREGRIDDLADAMLGMNLRDTDYAAKCDDALDARGIFGGALAGLGALTLVGVAVVRRPKGQAVEEPDNAAH